MSIARRIVAVIVVVAGAYAFYVFCVLPYRCNQIKKKQLLSTEYAFERAATPEGRIRARENLAMLLPCARASCRDVSLDMLIAANYRVLGQPQEAIRYYRDALRRDRRPEIYVNLATTEIAAGDRNAAREDFVQASLFSPWTISRIEDGLLRQEVVKRMIALRPESAEYIRYIDTIPPSGP